MTQILRVDPGPYIALGDGFLYNMHQEDPLVLVMTASDRLAESVCELNSDAYLHIFARMNCDDEGSTN